MSDNNKKLQDALRRLSATTIRARTEALEEVRRILNYYARSPIAGASSLAAPMLEVGTIHDTFEALFNLVSNLRNAYLTNKRTKGTENRVTMLVYNQLEDLAQTVRLAVAVGLGTFKPKTVRAILEHVVETLPEDKSGSEGNDYVRSYVDPLCLDYIKSVRAILEWGAHVEHLPHKVWRAVVLFCVEGIQSLRPANPGGLAEGHNSSNGAAVTDSTFSSRRTPDPSLTTSTRSTPPIRTRQAAAAAPTAGATNNKSTSRLDSSELILIVQSLVTAPNAPLSLSEPILDAIFAYLDAGRSIGRAHTAAFSCISAVLARCTLDFVRVAKSASIRLVREVKRLWGSARVGGLREEMLAALVCGLSVIHAGLKKNANIGPDTQAVASGQESPNSEDDNPAALRQLRIDIENLFDNMFAEYSKRLPERDMLSLTDLALYPRPLPPPAPPPPASACAKGHMRCAGAAANAMNTPAFALRATGNPRAESEWTIVRLLALFAAWLDEVKSSWAGTAVADSGSMKHGAHDSDGAQKRPRRKSRYLFDLLRQTVGHPQAGTRVTALQVLAFVVQEVELGVEDVRAVLERLMGCLGEAGQGAAGGVVMGWGMMGIVSCALQPSAQHPDLAPIWTTIWRVAARNTTLPMCCRPACHLLDALFKVRLVPYSSVAEVAEAMVTAVELNGPAIVADASCAFLATLIRVRGAENPSAFASSSDRVLNWVFGKWLPSKFDERTHTLQLSQTCCANDVAKLLSVCADKPFAPSRIDHVGVFGLVGTAWVRAARDTPLVNYLLLADDPIHLRNAEFAGMTATKQEVTTTVHSDSHSLAAETLIFDFCIGECDRARSTLQEWVDEKPQSITPDIVRVLSALCIVTSTCLSSADNTTTAATGTAAAASRPTRKIDTLRGAVHALISDVARFLARSDCEQDRVDAALAALSQHLPPVASLKSLHRDVFARAGAFPFALHMSKTLDERAARRGNWIADSASGDLMDLDDEFDSQISHRNRGDMNRGPTACVPRNDVVAMADMMGLRTEVSLYAYLIAFSFEEATLRDGEASVVPSAFVEKLVSLPALEFLASRAVVVGLLESDLQLKHEDLERMFENLGEKLMAGYEYERNEVALGMSLEALTATAVFWSDPGSGKLFDLVEDMYRWFIRVGLKPGLTSSAVHIGITNMLHSLLRVRPEYNVQLELPPIRESLFDILAVSDIPVKFHLTDILADIFGLFVLAEHDAIFEEVHAALVKLKDWHEDIFVWLVVLARLASTWQTLLRRCVYHIFEMAGAVHWATGHAARCIADVARALQLAGGANELFRLFAPQLLFTWGDCKFPLSNMPYVVFGYKSLKELILDVEDEVAGQVFMRANETDITALSAELDLSPAQLIERSFVKVAAYCISWDIRASLPGTGGAVASTPTTGTTPTTSTNESKARQHMGKEAYLKRLRQAFPRILSQFFVTMEGEDTIEHGIEKAFARRTTTMGASAKALNNMKAISSSGMSLPSGQQPLFKGRFLLDQIERLCRRSGDDPNHLWTPQLFTIVLRVLLDRIDPALGSLAACAFIRKIRILIVLAGPDVVGAGYPLEMALHALRPFLTNPHSADDALGIVQWLLDIGKDYLQAHLSFVAGFSLAVLIQLRVFLGSSQESTTQESQHMATMTKVHAFHTWFGSYLKSIRVPPGPPSPAFEAFRSMVRAACDIRSSGNAVKGTPESTLLFEVLLDEQQKKGLLDEPARVLALSLLCRDFRAPPPHHRDDILGADDTASEFAPLVWKSCLSVGAQSDGYLLWAARVLGRAYVSRNDFQQSLRRIVGGISPARKQLSDSEDTERSNINSRVAIVHAIADLFRSDERRHVGLAEETLRTMLARTADPVEMREIQEALPEMLVKALSLSNPEQAKLSTMRVQPELLKTRAVPEKEKEFRAWIRDLAIAVAGTTSNEVVIDSLPPILAGIAGLAEKLFPYILHNSLLRELDTQQHVRQVISEACQYWFENCNDATVPHAKILIEAILYLRTQPYPNEHTIADRQRWLELDYLQASEAAVKCGMHTTALLLAENHTPAAHTSRTSRRSSVLQQAPLPTSLLLQIYRNIEEPDSFYGVEQQPSLDSLLDRIDYEADGFKSLLLRGARLDSQMRRGDIISSNDAQGVVKSLIQLNLNSVTHSLLSRQQGHETGSDSVNCMLQTAMKLDQWDIKAPESAATETTTMFKAFQGLNRSANLTTAMAYLNEGFLNTLKGSISLNVLGPKMRSSLRTLASLTEMDEIVSIANPDDLREAFERMQNRQTWMDSALYEDIRPLLSYRGTLYSSLSCSDDLQSALHVRAKDCRRYEVQTLIRASSISRMHGALQESLTIATYLSDLVPVCRALGLAVEGAAQFETANVLWEQGEMTASVRILQHLVRDVNLDYEVDAAGKSVVLAKLGHHMAEARLEKGEEISQNYLIPAIRELKENTQGREAGQVYYEFASFCDRQLQNPDSLEDFTRMQKLVDRRRDEEDELSRITRSARSAEERRAHGRELSRVKKWLEIDGQEFQRLRVSRESFLRQSLENYLLCLQICDDFDSIVLRFFALWLENSGSSLANSAVRKNLREVPSRKFAVLMNQLSSRLQAEETDFQRLLSELVLRVCMQHPYHGMFQIYAGALGTDSREETAMSRKQAAKNIVSRFEKDKVAVSYWKAIYQSNSIYSMIAMTRDDGRDRFKAGRDYAINKFSAGVKLLQKIPTLQVPPATMSFEPRPDCNYTNLPKITHFKPRMTIAGGLSAPKIITAIASDGKQYKQLFKGGNDDLRQDAIMEQVFEEVSKLLKNNTATRQRDLHIRTYKVLPLSAQTGIMEFVQNTIALSSYLVPAHEKYHPKDWKNQTCRDKIDQVCKPTFSAEVRVKTFRTVTEHYQPVLRYFFLERFPDPDEWFQRRLAYTRTMAAISILGHVLGLGDRHCQNILLDEKSGEVVHIDLGVAFEAGRVLPIPEVVPFRLTRDLVDGMGYTKTEGVFRRCCEFTMDALREERESIMTLLNVLRYDPLYNWSVSPLKAKRIQEAQGNEGGGALDDAIDQASKRTEDEAGEAGRALSVVEKKLSKTLSTAATVNELIQQATDERNLALLFCGWAAWA